MRILIVLCLVLSFGTSVLFAENRQANVNVTLEIEGEYKFEPFKEASPGLAGLVDTGLMRIITKSEQGLSKYTALNDAMQKARVQAWDAVVNNHISENLTIKEAILNAPPYKEYKPKDDEKEKFDAMTDEERKAFVEEHGKEKKYDFENYLEIIKECGKYKNSGRFYDAVEKIGYACLEVRLEDFFDAVVNEKIDIFADLPKSEKYRPMDGLQSVRYDGVIIDASETEYTPQFFVKLTSPTEESVYEGIAGKKRIYFAKDIDDAKRILASREVHRVYSAKVNDMVSAVGLSLSLPDADRIFSAVSKDRNLPFVIIYKKEKIDTPLLGE